MNFRWCQVLPGSGETSRSSFISRSRRTSSASAEVRPVSATGSSDPHCTADPGTVPKAVDVLTPSGVSQSDELDYTKHDPVTLEGVTLP